MRPNSPGVASGNFCCTWRGRGTSTRQESGVFPLEAATPPASAEPSLASGLRRALSARFEVVEVDEHRMPRVCNLPMWWRALVLCEETAGGRTRGCVAYTADFPKTDPSGSNTGRGGFNQQQMPSFAVQIQCCLLDLYGCALHHNTNFH